MTYVYTYQDARPDRRGEPIYVGVGVKDRARVHLWKNTNRLLNAKIKKMRSAGLEPDITITECRDYEQAYMIERYMIRVCGQIMAGNGTLCNMTTGGQGLGGLPEEKRKEISAKISAAKKGKYSDAARAHLESMNRNKPKTAKQLAQFDRVRTKGTFTKEHAVAISKGKTGIRFSEEHKANLSKALLGPFEWRARGPKQSEAVKRGWATRRRRANRGEE